MSDNVDTSPLGIERTERIAGDAAVNSKLDIVTTELQNTQASVTTEVMHRSEGDLVVQRILEGYIQDLLDGKADDFERYIEFQNSQNLNYTDVRNFVSDIRTSLADEIRNLSTNLMDNLQANDARYNELVSDVDRYIEILSDITLDSNQITLDNGELRAGAWTILSQARQWDLDIISRLNGLSASVGESLKDAVEDIQNQLPSTEETITKAIEELSNSPIIKNLSDLLNQSIENDTAYQNELLEQARQHANAMAQLAEDIRAEALAKAQEMEDYMAGEVTARITEVNKEVAARKEAIDLLTEDMLTRVDQDKADFQADMLATTNRIIAAEDGLTSEIQNRKDGDSSTLNALNTYKVSNDTALTGLSTSLSNNVTKTNANTTLITGLTSRMDTAELGIESATTAAADAMSKATTAVSANSALATRVDALAASLTESDGTVVDVNAFNALKAEVNTVKGTVTGLVEDVTALESNYTSVNSKVTSQGTAIGTLNTKMSTAENSISQSANDITLLKTDISSINAGLLTKVDSQAFSQLSSDVSELDGKYTTQAGLVTDLRGSLDTTNLNVSNAASAAQNALNAAGSKGKVIFGSDHPAIEDRLSQNLWIDTTGNSNTPKRWNGSAWIEVTDKVATDALSAANAASALVNTKADATALNSLDQKVTVIDGQVNTNTNSIISLNGKITNVEGNLATKLDASVISNYYTKGQADDKSAEIAAGKIESYDANLVIGGVNLLKNSEGVFTPSTSKTDNYVTYQSSTVDMVNGKEYTLSGETNGEWDSVHDGAVESNRAVLWLVGNGINAIISNSNVGTKGRTFVWDNPSGTYSLRLNSYRVDNSIWFKKIKIESGNKRTDWTAAPEDVASDINKVQANLSNFQEAQVNVDLAQTNRLNAAESQLGANTARIANVEQTYATRDGVAALARSALQSEWQMYANNSVNNLQIGGRNLLLNSNYSTNPYKIYFAGGSFSQFGLSSVPDQSEAVLDTDTFITVSVWYTQLDSIDINKPFESLVIGRQDLNADLWNIRLYTTDASIKIVKEGNLYKLTGTVLIPKGGQLFANYPRLIAISGYGCYLHKIKIEKGSKATDYSPAPEDLIQDLNTFKSTAETIYSTKAEANSTTADIINHLTSKANQSGLDALSADVANNYYTKAQTDSVTAGVVNSYKAELGNIINYTVVSRGNESGGIGYILNAQGNWIVGGSRSYTLVVFNSDGTINWSRNYDIFGNPGINQAFYDDINALASGVYVVIFTSDEPASNRNADLVFPALKMLGGTREVNDKLGYRGSYMLIGRKGMVEGTAVELVAPANQIISYALQFVNGVPVGIGNTPTAMPSQFASASALSALDTKVTSIDGRVTSNAGSITNLQAGLTAANNSISTKADSSALNALTARVDSTESGIQATNISVTSLESKLNNVSVGATNLLPDTKNVGNMGTYLGFGYKRTTRPGGSNHYVDTLGYFVNNLSAGTYVLSFYARANKVQYVNNFFYAPDNTQSAESSTGAKTTGANGKVSLSLTTEWKRYWVRWVIPSDTESKGLVVARLDDYDSSERWIEIAAPKLEKGTLATDWSPATSDTASAAALSTLDTKVTSIDGKVTTHASSITQLQADVSGNSSKLIVQGDVVNGLKASYVVKTDVNGLVTGYGLYNEGGVGAFGVNADYFYVGNGTTATGGKKPFMVLTSAQTIGGVTYPAGTWIDVALIANATIGSAHIANASITDAHIVSLNASKITAGIIDAERIGANSISVEKLMVGDATNLWGNQHFTQFNPYPKSPNNRERWVTDVTELKGNGIQMWGRDHYAPYTSKIPLKEGDTFVIEYIAGRNGGPDVPLYVGLWTYNINGNGGSTPWQSGPAEQIANLGGGWFRWRRVFVVTNDGHTLPVAYGVLFFNIMQAAEEPDPAYWSVGDVTVRKGVGGELIVNGSVTADKMQVDSLSAISADLGTIKVGSANIADLAVTTAKIGDLQVDTLKIKDNAVTVPVYSYTSGIAYIDSSRWITSQSIWAPCSNGVTLFFFNFSYDCRRQDTRYAVKCRILKDGVIVRPEFTIFYFEADANSINVKSRPAGTLSLNHADDTGVDGTFELQFYMSAGNGWNVDNRYTSSLTVRK